MIEKIRENINPASIKGVIGRKWYFIISLAIGGINGLLMNTLAPSISDGIFEAVKNNDTTNVYSIFNSGLIPDGQMYAFLFLALAGAFFGFANNTKRIKDITAKNTKSLILSGLVLIATFSLYFFNLNSFMYMLVYTLNMLIALILIFKEGKCIKPKTAQIKATARSEMIETRKSVSFWRRIFAHFIDSLIVLNVVLLLLLVVGAPLWYKAGTYGIAVSLILYALYYGIMNSRVANGQTIGKKVLGIKVVDSEGDFLPLNKSLIRSIIYTICGSFSMCLCYAASTILPDYIIFQADFIYTCSIFIMLTLALYGTFLFNTKTRQTFHDFASGSYVVLKSNYNRLYNPHSNPLPAFSASILSLIICIIIASMLTGGVTKLPVKPAFTKQISNDLHIEALNTSFDKSKSELTITVRTQKINNQALAENVYRYITENYSGAELFKTTNIVLQNSYLVGAIGEVKQHTYSIK